MDVQQPEFVRERHRAVVQAQFGDLEPGVEAECESGQVVVGRSYELHFEVETELATGIDVHNAADVPYDWARDVLRSFVGRQPGGAQVEILDAP